MCQLSVVFQCSLLFNSFAASRSRFTFVTRWFGRLIQRSMTVSQEFANLPSTIFDQSKHVFIGLFYFIITINPSLLLF
uniref:Secreted protein n=1 Tax=Ascaris lumbricoides TaxID=6252 RepID=A0A0M3ILH5_ASCLU